MNWKTIIIRENDRLSLKDNQFTLIDKKENTKLQFSLDDINCIILENSHSYLTSYLLSKLAENNISLIVTNEKYDPTGLFVSLNQHFSPLSVFRKQLKMTQRFKDLLWKKIIQKKIENSILVLEQQKPKINLKWIKTQLKKVENGDKTNREGAVAKYFFKKLYGAKFVRFADDNINNALNYGYKILTSALSRTIISYGLNNHLGIKHCGPTNWFNLSSDFIEPLRSLVDCWVVAKLSILEKENRLSSQIRGEIVKILYHSVKIDNLKTKVYIAIDIMVKSFISCLKENSVSKIKLPTLITQESTNGKKR
ncbi:MAG: type II CRISPR-associated endonuclease Cas1 [Candidatus Moeniiplasma glomeromycotorum]|nr:type II CRISPR-associated endonuclease Cas1 [Candidatus Moeniiplasma glomeromycotorum]MCE8167709.1 type II CRISPR-associated endonuclease Cas1 [Candidatus Moeniiplasma glomeromycotorum]MCE8169109.1 type II CRISPR-associated endonuclease Cas1 [Candidatus Moeniiplasma glomeromycotorum]